MPNPDGTLVRALTRPAPHLAKFPRPTSLTAVLTVHGAMSSFKYCQSDIKTLLWDTVSQNQGGSFFTANSSCDMAVAQYVG